MSLRTAELAASRGTGPPRPVITATGTGTSHSSAFLDLVLLPPPTASPSYLTTRQPDPPRPTPRTTAFGRITDASTPALRLGITSDAQLRLA